MNLILAMQVNFIWISNFLSCNGGQFVSDNKHTPQKLSVSMSDGYLQAQQLVTMICYPGGVPGEVESDDEEEDEEDNKENQKQTITRILQVHSVARTCYVHVA